MTHRSPRQFKHHPLLALQALAAGALLAACGGDDTITGVFLDAPVQGLEYVAGTSAARTTNAAGEFSCVSGETVSFRLGGVALGSAACQSLLTPLSLAGTTDADSAAVTNRVMTLQLLDNDADPSNGILLTADLRAALASKTLDFSASAPAFDSALTALLATLPEPYKSRPVSGERRTLASEQFQNTLAQAGQPVAVSVSQSGGAGTVTASITRMTLQAGTGLGIAYEGSNTAIKADFPNGFFPAYGSGLAFKDKKADGSLEFYAVTDRGPNGDGPTAPVPGSSATSASKVFPAPSFAPAIGLITVGKNGAVLSAPMPLKVSAAQTVSGLPIQTGTGASGEVPLTDTYRYLGRYDANGIDPESLVLDKARNAFWVSDEYGPFILRANATTGVIEKRYAPGSAAGDLPAVLAARRANRGMEGLTLAADGKLHGFLQSPIDPKDGAGKSIKATPPGGSSTDVRHIARFIRWIELDPATDTSKLYAYPVDGSLYDKNRTGNAKLGDVAALGNGKFLVIEQGARKSDAKVQNWLMLVEIPANASNIAGTDHSLEISSITGAVSGAADYSTVVTLRKTRLLDLNAAGWLAEKAEGLTVVDANTIALINDNDFGLRTILLDAAGNTVAGSIEDCTVDANGTLVSGCPASVTGARLTRAVEAERATRLWTLRFDKPLASYSVP